MVYCRRLVRSLTSPLYSACVVFSSPCGVHVCQCYVRTDTKSKHTTNGQGLHSPRPNARAPTCRRRISSR